MDEPMESPKQSHKNHDAEVLESKPDWTASALDGSLLVGWSRVRDPLELLRRIRRILGSSGEFDSEFENARRHSVISRLLRGRWPAAGQSSPDGRPLRFYTR